MTEQNTKYVGYKFIHQLYKLFTARVSVESDANLIYNVISKKENSPKISPKALKQLNLSQDSVIKNIAFYKALQGEGGYYEEFNEIITNMYNNPKWLDKLKKQAKERKITFEENIKRNVEYIINHRKIKNKKTP